MSDNKILLVPISVEGICVGKGKTDQKYRFVVDPHVDFSNMPYYDSDATPHNDDNVNVSTSSVLGQPFGETKTKAAGVYLHWALPDGIAHGTQNAEGELDFPHAPNRWLVTRIFLNHADASTVKTKSWIVESDVLIDDETAARSDTKLKSAAIPLKAGEYSNAPPYQCPKPFMHIGNIVEEVLQWTEPAPKDGGYLDHLTVLGYGEPTYAAFHPNCPNVFSIYDPASDLTVSDWTQARLSYVVIGWHSNAANDPMQDATWRNQVNGEQWTGAPPGPNDSPRSAGNPFKWAFTPGTPVPERSLYKGVLTAMAWDGSDTKNFLAEAEPDYDISDETTVAVGNSVAEALSAYIANTTVVEGEDISNIEFLINALQLNALDVLAAPGGVGQAEARLHQSGFGAHPGGTVWGVRNDEAGADTLPIISAHLLNQLNLAQQQLDENGEISASLQQQIFYDWVKYMETRYGQVEQLGDISIYSPRDVQSAREQKGKAFAVNVIHKYIDSHLKKLTEIISDPTQRDTFLTDLGNFLVSMNQDSKKNWELTVNAAPRYWQPADPVLIINAGNWTQATSHFGDDGRFTTSGYLECRLDDAIVTSLTLGAGAITGSAEATLKGDDLSSNFNLKLKTDPKQTSIEFAPIILKLLEESILLDPWQAAYVARNIAQQGGANNPAQMSLSGTIDLIEKFLGPPAGRPSTVSSAGSPPSPVGNNVWDQTSWLPIAMDWQVDFKPVQKIDMDSLPNYDTKLITGNFKLDPDQIDLYYDYDARKQLTAKPETYSNSLILDRHATINLKSEIDRIKDQYADDKQTLSLLNQIENNLGGLNIMAHTLSGFNDALLMRHQVLQLQITDPMALNPIPDDYSNYDAASFKWSLHQVAPAVADENTAAPLPNNDFNPIRAGEMVLGKLRIIDTFGRFKCISFTVPDNLDVCASATWKPPKFYAAWSLKPVDPDASASRINYLDFVRDFYGKDGAPDTKAHTLVMPPRITQPARLLFRWVSAVDTDVEMNAHPATSPICGWVVHNRLENSLVFYDETGGIIGSLYSLAGGDDRKWQGTPATPYFGQSFDNIFRNGKAGLNPELKKFACGLYDNGPAFLHDFLALIDNSLTTIEPLNFHEDPTMALYFGRPLAIAIARLLIDLKGLPAFNQSYRAFANDGDMAKNSTPEYKIFDRTSNGFTAVEFPVRLGQVNKLDDGLVGYFKGTVGPPMDYSTFFAPAGPGTSVNHIVRPTPTDLMLTCSSGSSPHYVTLLLDPRCSVHATTGILPVKSIEIPPVQYTEALRNMVINFLSAPVLNSAKGVELPLPYVSEGNWKWLQQINGQWQSIDVSKPLDKPRFDFSPRRIIEGWLQLRQK